MILEVFDQSNGLPLSRVNIYQGSRDAPTFLTTTDDQGKATLDNPGRYNFSHIGYEVKALDVPLTSAALSVPLTPTGYNLPEVVIRPDEPKNNNGLLIALLLGVLILFNK